VIQKKFRLSKKVIHNQKRKSRVISEVTSADRRKISWVKLRRSYQSHDQWQLNITAILNLIHRSRCLSWTSQITYFDQCRGLFFSITVYIFPSLFHFFIFIKKNNIFSYTYHSWIIIILLILLFLSWNYGIFMIILTLLT
jgi:hypothetical protein